ncbi:MAG: AraC family transcriptional regulator [Rhodospirillales bacterium]|nr:AraC family transcriptional regulator [Rhodospirillales bacterium]
MTESPLARFTTTTLPPVERFGAWQMALAGLFDATPLGPVQPRDFCAGYDAFAVGRLVIGETHYAPHQFRREAAKLRQDGLDHFHVTLHRRGGHRAAFAGGCMVEVGPGDIEVFDFARPLIADAETSSMLVLAVPRSVMASALPQIDDLHGVTIAATSGLASLLGAHLTTLYAQVRQIAAHELDAAEEATLAMVAACIRPSTETIARASAELEEALLSRIRRHIERELASSDLTPAQLCLRFRISRGKLYRLFESLGGVAAYIQLRRLYRIHALLLDPTNRHRRNYDIAFEHGFNNEAHFSRAFRKLFGATPSDARRLPPADATQGMALVLDRMRR